MPRKLYIVVSAHHCYEDEGPIAALVGVFTNKRRAQTLAAKARRERDPETNEIDVIPVEAHEINTAL